MDGEFYEGRIGSQLGGIVSGTAEGSFTTGTFAFDEDTLRGIIRDWGELGHSYQDSMRTAISMAMVAAPADDFASTAHARAANAAGEAYLRYLEHNRDYCLQQERLFQQALDDYLGIEQRNVTEIDRSGPQPGI